MTENQIKQLDEVCDPLTVKKFSTQFVISKEESVKIIEEYLLNKKEDTQLWALHEVCGYMSASEFSFLPKDSADVLKIVVVPGKEIEEAKKGFNKVLSTSLHSIQRTNPKETRVYGRQWDNNKDLEGVSLPKQQGSGKSATPEVNVPSSSKSSSSKPVKQEVVKVKKEKPAAAPKKNGNLMNMFGKSKAKETKKKSPEKKVEKEVKKESSEEPMDSEERSPSPVIEKKSRKRPNIDFDDSFDSPKKEESPPSSREVTPQKEEPKPKRTKKSVNDENKKAKKKLIVDSDEEVDEVQPVSRNLLVNDRKRAVKMETVVETFVDEDGFLVSKEVKKTTNISPEKMKSPEKAKPKITAPIPGEAKVPKKNSTITSFFKKS